MPILAAVLAMFPLCLAPAPATPSTDPGASARPAVPFSEDERDCADDLIPEAQALRQTLDEQAAAMATLETRDAELERAIAAAKQARPTLADRIQAKKEARDEAAARLTAIDLEIAQARAAAAESAARPVQPRRAAAPEPAAEPSLAPLLKRRQDGLLALETLARELKGLERELADVDRRRATAEAEIADNARERGELEESGEATSRELDEVIAAARLRGTTRLGRLHLNRQLNRCKRGRANARIEAQIDAETRTFRSVMKGARASRCATALCWGPSNKFAFEPLAELPIGKSFAFPNSGLARYVNSNDIQVSFNAGVRFWMAWDWVSLSVYLSKPILHQGEAIHVSGSNTEFSTSQVRRPYPGVAIGLFGDILWLAFDYDQLRNGNAGVQRAPEYRPNEIVSHAYTFTIAIAPIAGIRNGLGTIAERNRRQAEEKALAAAAAQAADAATKAEQASRRAEEAARKAEAAGERDAGGDSTSPTIRDVEGGEPPPVAPGPTTPP